MSEIRLKDIAKTYDRENTVIKDLNLGIREGEFIVLVGPSGCGKTTTLRLIAGLEEVTEGQIFIDSRDVTYIPPKDRDIAMVFQNYALYPHMNVYNNMAFGLKLRKLPKNEIRMRVEEAAKILDIKDLLERKPKQLSGGQRQRIALGRAIVRQPKAFLFDEPLSNLDAKLRVQMRAEIKKLHKNLKTTMVYVTHDQIEAMTMGDRVVVMNNGIIHQVDTPIELYRKPADTFVAGFIGSPGMNFLEMEISDNGMLKGLGGGLQFDIPDLISDKIKTSGKKKVTMGIRPEDIFLEKEEGMVSIDAELELTEIMGKDVFIYLAVNELRMSVRASHEEFMASEKLKVYFNRDKVHYFYSDTGLRIN